MAIDLSKPDLIVAVFGAGTMGRGIAQVSAQAGLTTLLFDSTDGAVKTAIAAIDRGLEGLVAKERMTAAAKQDVLNRLNPINSLDEAKGAGIVIEAIVEDLKVKRELFREWRNACPRMLCSPPIRRRCRSLKSRPVAKNPDAWAACISSIRRH